MTLTWRWHDGATPATAEAPAPHRRTAIVQATDDDDLPWVWAVLGLRGKTWAEGRAWTPEAAMWAAQQAVETIS